MSTDNVIPIHGGPSTSASPLAKPPRKKRRASLNRAQLAERIEAERRKLFGAMGVVGIVRQALQDSESADNLQRFNVVSNAWCALEAAYEVMNGIAGAMEADVFLG